MKILISGASGLVGKALCNQLSQTHDIIRLVRHKTTADNELFWDYTRHYIDPRFINHQFDAVIHLSGENIASGPWTKKRRREIVNSRTESTLFLSDLIIQQKKRPHSFISASAIGIYGDCGEKKIDEKSRAGTGFLADTCNEWEYCSKHLMNQNIRVAHIRTGIVLSKEGGFLAKMRPIFNSFLGGRLGNGQAYLSWIDHEDIVNIFQFVLENNELDGPINATSPNPVTNEEFTRLFASRLHRPAFLHIPAWFLKLIFADMAKETMLASSRVIPQKLLDSGFKFIHEELDSSLKNI